MQDEYLGTRVALSSGGLPAEERERLEELVRQKKAGSTKIKRPRKEKSHNCAVCGTAVDESAGFRFKRWIWCGAHLPSSQDDLNAPFKEERRQYALARYRQQNPVRTDNRGRQRLPDPALTVNPTALEERVMAEAKGVCAYGCGRRASVIDLYTPRRLGGKREYENMRACCLACRMFKADADPESWERCKHAFYDVKKVR